MIIDMQKIIPQKGRVVIEIVERVNNKVGSIYIPDIALRKEASNGVLLLEGIVHKIGKDCDESLKVGQLVYFNVYKANHFEESMIVCDDKEIYGIVEE